MADATSKLDHGIKTTSKCTEAFDLIVKDTSEVNDKVNEITSAFKEQTIGVQEITKAVTDLDLVTQQNAISAKENVQSAEILNKDALDMENVTRELLQIVTGKSDKAA